MWYVLVCMLAFFVLSGCSPTHVENIDSPIIADEQFVCGGGNICDDALHITDQYAIDQLLNAEMPSYVSADIGSDLWGYRSYDDVLMYAALDEGYHVVLFFYADWCPSCRIVDINYRIQASVAPTDVLIMRVEYDNRRDLVRHYGVTSQDSFVYINKDGSVRGRQIGGLYSLVDIVQRIEGLQ